MKFTPKDIEQIHAKGLTVDDVNEQLSLFEKGITYADIREAANIDNGILHLSEKEEETCQALYEKLKEEQVIIKFTPSSGAATRMFKFLFRFLETYNPEKDTINGYINRKKATDLKVFFVGLDKFPFYDDVVRKIYWKTHGAPLTEDTFRYEFVKMLLDESGLHYGKHPKGLLPFHKYKNHTATPFEEHLFESAKFACVNKKVQLHFTISPEHLDAFKSKEEEMLQKIEKDTGCTFDIDYSFQEPATDTIAVTTDNTPFRDDTNALIFRPGGHGALLQNLNKLDADLIFIKNIDNVVVNKYEEQVVAYKKILAGKLLEVQQKVHGYLNLLDRDEEVPVEGILTFLHNELNVIVTEEFEKYSQKYQLAYLREKLNRPIRVCGMVKNEGEPGGGPFWVKHENATVSLQIVESAQIDKKNNLHQKILEKSAYFNPVDVVCGVKDHEGKKYDLMNFVDKKTYFIASKSKSGKHLKALERPGLWNGGMAHWNTIFVEVPLFTFNPVKTVNDLLKPSHQKYN